MLFIFRCLCLSFILYGSVAHVAANDRIAELDFNNIKVGDALRILSQQSGLNIITSQAAANIEMTMYLHDIKPLDVLEAMAKTYNLWYQEDKKSKVIRIYTVKEFRLGKVDYRNERTEIFTFKHQRTSLDFAYMIRDLFGYQRVTLNKGANEKEILNDLNDRMSRFKVIASNAKDSNFSSGSSGGGNSSNNNSSSNTNSSNNNSSRNGSNGNTQNGGQQMQLRRNQALDLNKILPKSEAQAMLSGGFNHSQRSVNDLIEHISPIYVTLVRRQNRVLVRTRDKDALQEIQGLFTKLNIDMATVLLEVKVLQLDLSDGFESGFDFSVKSGETQVNNINNGGLLNNLKETLAGVTGNPAMVAGLVTRNFAMRLQFMEKEGRVTELATPMLTTTNQEVSRIFIGEERPITTNMSVTCPTTTNTDTNSGASITTNNCIQVPNTAIRPIGKTLLLTPNINSNGTIDIRLLVEDSKLCEHCGKIPATNLGGTLTNYAVDTVKTQVFSGNIIASNGQMIAVGGLIDDQSTDTETKVPILGDIPYLGVLFTDTIKSRKRTEMVILIRPYVMTTQQARTETNKQWLQQNSQHPAADDLNRLGIYENNQHLDKGYQLQDNYKIYTGQDQFDDHHEKGAFAINKPDKLIKTSDLSRLTENKQATYVQLTQYAAKAVRGTITQPASIKTVTLNKHDITLQYDKRLSSSAVKSWRKGGIYVTAVQVVNHSTETVAIDYQHLKGVWLAATTENEQLAPNQSSYLYLISADHFENTVRGY